MEIDAGPPAGPGIVDRVEIDQQTAKIWPKDGRVMSDQSISTMSSTRRIIECTIGFEAVPGVREVSHVILALVDLRLDDWRGNPAWRQQTGSSIPERCLMLMRIGRASGGRGRPGKHFGNTGNHSGKVLPVRCRHGGIGPKSTGAAWNSREASRRVKKHREESSGRRYGLLGGGVTLVQSLGQGERPRRTPRRGAKRRRCEARSAEWPCRRERPPRSAPRRQSLCTLKLLR